jgi:thymidylate synthase
MKVYREKYAAAAYKKILNDLLNNPEYVSKPRNMEVREILNCIIEIEYPNFNMYKNEVRSSQEKYIAAELLFYFSGTDEATFIERYASMWKSLKDKNNRVNSAYGYLLFNEENVHGLTQYEWAIETLKRDKDSRQAIMHFNKPHHQHFDNKDQVCTLTSLFHIRNNKLHMTLNMRSNDVILGFMTDFTFFNILHQQAYLHLKEYYPELKMGSYTHTSHSMHLYERHYDKVKEMLEKPFIPDGTPDLNTSIIHENGLYLDKYKEIFEPIELQCENPTVKYTDNDIINWALNKIQNND